MNTTCQTGRLTKKPEVKYTQGSNPTAIANFSIAVDRIYKRDGQPDTDFFEVTAFGKPAEFAEKYLDRGIKVELVGRLQQDRWTDKDGNNKSKTVIIAEYLRFAESKSASQNSQSQQSQEQPQQAAPQSQQKPDMGFMEIPDGIEEALPFS